MPNLAIPVVVKHMTIAIYREGHITAKTPADRFKQCFMIAKARCAQYGLVSFSGASLTEAIALTPKGRSAELRHKSEGRSKTVLFDTLYDRFDLEGVRAARAAKEQAGRDKAAAAKKTPAPATKKAKR